MSAHERESFATFQKMTNFLVLLVVLSYTWIGSDCVPFHDCGSEYDLDTVDIEGCVNLPCTLIIGRQYNISMGFIAKSRTRKLEQSVFLILRTVYKKLEVIPADACNKIACPISNNLSISFSALVTITKNLVPLDGELYWSLRNDNEKEVICMRTPIVLRR